MSRHVIKQVPAYQGSNLVSTYQKKKVYKFQKAWIVSSNAVEISDLV